MVNIKIINKYIKDFVAFYRKELSALGLPSNAQDVLIIALFDAAKEWTANINNTKKEK